jgi:hypothetical protein
MTADVRRQLAVYGTTFKDAWWQQVRPEVLCLVRRLRPTTKDYCRALLTAARCLFRAVANEDAGTSLTDALTTVHIERYLRTLNAKNAITRRPLLLRLMAIARGLPSPAPPRRRDRSRSLSPTVADWMRQAQSGTPMTDILSQGCTPKTLQVMSPHLPSGDIPAYRGVLRG